MMPNLSHNVSLSADEILPIGPAQPPGQFVHIYLTYRESAQRGHSPSLQLDTFEL